MIDQAAIEEEIRGGLKNELGRDRRASRLEEARSNDLYYDGQFEQDTQSWGYDDKSLVTVLLMRRVVELLTANLYRKGPERSWQGLDNATAALQSIYQANAADALWQEADRLTLINQVAAIQVEPDPDGTDASPYKFYLWGGNDVVVWLDSDDARKPGAVATLDLFDNSRRLRLYTEAERVTYQTAKLQPLQTSGGTAFREVDRAPNPYGLLPFAFAHSSFPARFFWTPAPGTVLRQLNYHVNYRLTLAADDVIHNRPRGVIEGTLGDFRFPDNPRAGEWISIPSISDAGGGVMGDPRASYITCDFGYLSQDLEQLQTLLDRALEMLGIPAASIRLEQSSTQSGVALMAEQVPIVLWSEARQRPFAWYEQGLARLIARMAATEIELYGLPDVAGATVEEWLAASQQPIHVKYPAMQPDLPGPARDQSDQWLLDNQLTSRTRLVMERFKMTDDQATDYLAKVAEELTTEAELFGPANQAWASSMTPPMTETPTDAPDGSGDEAEPGSEEDGSDGSAED
jgi:hypothetical protein